MLPLIGKKRGFTLIELLVVIAILSVLLVIVLIAINPARQTRDARNTQRRADVLTILNAVNQHFIATGTFPGLLDSIATGSAQAINDGNSTLDGSDFCDDLVTTGNYIAALPFDPISGKGYGYTDCNNFDTGYTITRQTGDRVTVEAPETEPSCTPGTDCIKATR